MLLTLNLLTTTIVAPPSNASKWQMGFNSTFKGLKAQNGVVFISGVAFHFVKAPKKKEMLFG